jgi:cell shape-determining protein MreD
MTPLNSILMLLVTFLAVFCEAAFGGLRNLLGAQIDLLPSLVVCASLSSGLATMSLVAVLGGLFFDSLSANPLGVSVLPLFLIGFAIYIRRDLLLREQLFAQWVLGLAASAIAPALTLLLLLTGHHRPLLGWVTIWQWIVMSVGGAIATPALLLLFDWFERQFSYQRASETSFRPDREIRRGRK